MIEGDSRSKYQPTIEAAVKAENERIIERYAKKKDKTKSFVRAKLVENPDFLKGFKFSLAPSLETAQGTIAPEDTDIAPIGNYNVYGKDLAYIAPIEERDVVDRYVSDNAADTEVYTTRRAEIKAELKELAEELDKLDDDVNQKKITEESYQQKIHELSDRWESLNRELASIPEVETSSNATPKPDKDAEQKKYTKKSAMSIVEKTLGQYKISAKSKRKLADALWSGMNNSATVEEKEMLSSRMAESIVGKMLKEAKVENPEAKRASEQLEYLSRGIGTLKFTKQDIEEIKHVRDQKGLRQILGRWGFKGDRVDENGRPQFRRYPMETFVADIAREMPKMANYEDMSPTDAFLELDRMYSELSETVKNKTQSAFLDMPDSDIPVLRERVADTILEAFETEGKSRTSLDIAYDKIYARYERDKQTLNAEYVGKALDANKNVEPNNLDAYLSHLNEQYEQRLAELREEVEKAKKTAVEENERIRREELHKAYNDELKQSFEDNGIDIEKVLENAKNKATFTSVDNTPQRFTEKTFGYKAGQIINDHLFNKVALNESKGISWLNEKVALFRELSKKYNIKPRSKKSAAAQMYAEGFYFDEDEKKLVKYGDSELAKDFPDRQDQEDIKGIAKDPAIRKFYDKTLDEMNAERVKNGYPPIPKKKNYFLHFREMNDVFTKLGVPFNPGQIKLKDLPTDINGKTADFKPGKPYFASEKQRIGFKTTYDILGGAERYANQAKNQIFHISDIQRIRAFGNFIADRYGQANGLGDLDSMEPDEQVARIKNVFDKHLTTYAKFLNEEANVLAGKTTLVDRALEHTFGRRAIQFIGVINSQVGKNMVGLNIASAGTNLISLVQATAVLPKRDIVKAYAQTVANKFHNDGFVENDPALIRRRGADKFAKTRWEKWSDAGYFLMSGVDNFCSEVIVRAKYNQLMRMSNGTMDSETAHIKAGEWAMRLLGDRSLGQMPQLYNSKMFGLFTKFQLEVRNQLDFMFYDTVQEAKVSTKNNAKRAAKIASTLAQLAIFQHLFGVAYEKIAGYNPTFDLVEIFAKMFGFDDDEESEDTFSDNLEQAFQALLDDLPYISIITDGGRIPISNALPVTEFINGKDDWGNEKSRLETLGEIAPYLLPTGGGQLKKTYQGLKMFSDEHPIAGSYTESGNLRFPVEDTVINRIQAGLFGQYASENAREYFDNDYAPIKQSQIDDFIESGMSYTEWQKSKKQGTSNSTESNKKDETNELLYSLVGGSDAYAEYSEMLSYIVADKDALGNTIPHSRQRKVIQYLNSLDVDGMTRLILYKKQFPNDTRFNASIVNALKNRSDLTYDEMVAILNSLGMNVSAEGRVTWW